MSGTADSVMQCHIPEDTHWHEVLISRITLGVRVREGIVMYLATQISSSGYNSSQRTEQLERCHLLTKDAKGLLFPLT